MDEKIREGMEKGGVLVAELLQLGPEKLGTAGEALQEAGGFDDVAARLLAIAAFLEDQTKG